MDNKVQERVAGILAYCANIDNKIRESLQREQKIYSGTLVNAVKTLMVKYLLYVNGDEELTDEKVSFLNRLCDDIKFKTEYEEIYNHYIKNDTEYTIKIPSVLMNLLMVDSLRAQEKRHVVNASSEAREETSSAWALVVVLTMLGNRFSGAGVHAIDTMEKIERRKNYINYLAKYIEENMPVNAKKYDYNVPFVPCIPETPLRGNTEEQLNLLYTMEYDNPFMTIDDPLVNEYKNPSEKNKKLFIKYLYGACKYKLTDGDKRRFNNMLRAGMQIPEDFQYPSEKAPYATEHDNGYLIDYDDFYLEPIENNDDQEKIKDTNIIDQFWENYYSDNETEDALTDIIRQTINTTGGIPGRIIIGSGMGDFQMENDTHTQIEPSIYDDMSLSELHKELNSLIGLENVKTDLKQIINYMKITAEREKHNLKSTQSTKHMVFMGNPGTGKTTVARLIAAIYKKMGFLSKGQFIETDAEGLIAGYVGQTAIKTKELVESAIGGVLFIDEAYMLNPKNHGNDFAKEAIATLIKMMEDHRDDLVVIFAGYTDLMNEFLNGNPGIRSRINKYLKFENYNGEQLTNIFKLMCKKNDYIPDKKCVDFAKKYFTDRASQNIEHYANGRDVRNFMEKAIINQSTRLANDNQKTHTLNALKNIKLEDVNIIDLSENDDKQEKKHQLGFHV